MAKPGRPRKEGDDVRMRLWAKDRRRKQHQKIYGKKSEKTQDEAEAVGKGQSHAPENHEDGPKH